MKAGMSHVSCIWSRHSNVFGLNDGAVAIGSVTVWKGYGVGRVDLWGFAVGACGVWVWGIAVWRFTV